MANYQRAKAPVERLGTLPETAAREVPTWRPSGLRRVTLDAFAGGHVPVLRIAGAAIDRDLDARARWLLPLIDGTASLERVFVLSGMPTSDALQAMCELLERKIVVLR